MNFKNPQEINTKNVKPTPNRERALNFHHSQYYASFSSSSPLLCSSLGTKPHTLSLSFSLLLLAFLSDTPAANLHFFVHVHPPLSPS